MEPDRPDLEFFVAGIPRPEGSKRGFARGGRVVLVEMSKDLPDWRADVRRAASEARGEGPLWLGPLTMYVSFSLPLPKSKATRSGQRKPDAYPAGAPDLDKLIRAVGDAMQDVVYRNDGQLVSVNAAKQYCWSIDAAPGARILLWRLR